MRIFATALVWLAVFCAAALAQTRVSPSGTLNDLRNTALRGTVPIEEIEMRSGQRARCAETCSAHPLCRGFNWRKGAEGRRPQCTLLHRVFETVQSPFFHSGVRSGQTPVFDGTREADAELLGEVAHEFALPDAKPVLCRDACSRDKGCAGWTYLRPDVLRIGSAPVCRMLTAVTERRAAPCCVSGQRRETFQAFRCSRDTRVTFAVQTPIEVTDVRACIDLCRADDTCTRAVYEKTSATRAVGRCVISGDSPMSVASDDGFSTYERASPDLNMRPPRPGVRNTAPNYRRIRLDVRSHADAVSLCAAACGRDANCVSANVQPATDNRSARCNLKQTLATNVFDDCCTNISKIPNSKPPSVPAPDAVPLRMVFSPNDPGNRIEGDAYPADMPNVRFPVNWQGCSQDDRALIRRAWVRAHYNVWRARQVMSHLNAQRRRADMWAWSFNDRMGTSPSYTNISPRAYFGRYDHSRFHDARRVIDKLFVERFRGKTFRVKCRVRDSDGAHPCETFNANANHSFYGTINLCQRWFDNGVFNDQVTILTHEMLHWMKIPKSIYWVADRHDFWRSCRRYVGVRALYDDDAVWLGMNRGCKDWNHNRAVRANDTYAWWTTMLGDRIYRGRLPQFPAEDF